MSIIHEYDLLIHKCQCRRSAWFNDMEKRWFNDMEKRVWWFSETRTWTPNLVMDLRGMGRTSFIFL